MARLDERARGRYRQEMADAREVRTAAGLMTPMPIPADLDATVRR